MATPTPPGSKKPGGNVSTPSHLNQSSPPRSVPSPITARHPAGKTPINHPTTGSSSGSKTLAGTPMVQNLSQGGNTASPTPNMLGLGTPSGLGIEGATPAGLTGLTPALGGAQMMPTMSDLGLTLSGGKRNEDDERRLKMRKVLRSIGRDKGRVSEEGIVRVARRVGFANDIDAEKLSDVEMERKVGNRSISTAGNAIVIDTDLKNQVPRSVQVTYSTESKALEEHGAKAGQVLLADLTAPDGVALNAKLDRFAVNLERLARMDRLSAAGINCFEAVSGLYASLERLYEQEKAAVKALLRPDSPNAEERAEMEVMCKKSGKPLVHANGKIGIELAYWQDSRHVSTAQKDPQTGTMDIDGREDKKNELAGDGQYQVFKLRVEVESCSASLYPSLRVSDAWLPDPLELPSADSAEGIPWQDPPPTYTTSNGVDNGAMMHGQLPDLRFVAKLDPPIVVPSYILMNIQAALDIAAPVPMSLQYAEVLLDPTASQRQQAKVFKTSAKQSVLSFKDGHETTVQHFYKLENARLDCGNRIDQLPFSHPRQLVELLPMLRQWACVGSFLKITLGEQPHRNGHVASNEQGEPNGAVSDTSGLEDLLMDTDPVSDDGILVNIGLVTAPTPSLGITFPKANGSDVANINVEVLANADITATDSESSSQNGDSTKIEETQKRQNRLAKALDACGDLGVWVEWVRTQT